MYLCFLMPDQAKLASFHFSGNYIYFCNYFQANFLYAIPSYWLRFRKVFVCGLRTATLSRWICRKESPHPGRCSTRKIGAGHRKIKRTRLIWRLFCINCTACLCCIVKVLVWRFPVLPLTVFCWMFSAGLPALRCIMVLPFPRPWEDGKAVAPCDASCKAVSKTPAVIVNETAGVVKDNKSQALSLKPVSSWLGLEWTKDFFCIFWPGPSLAALRWRGGLCMSEQCRTISIAGCDQFVF